MQVSEARGHCFSNLWASARGEAAEVLLDTQKSVGHPSGAALQAVLKGDGSLLVGFLGPLRAEQLKYVFTPRSRLTILQEQLSSRSQR